MATKAPSNKAAAAPEVKSEEPVRDRPMTGIHTRPSEERTEHGLSPLDPAYLGTPVQENDAQRQARDARVKAGLEAAQKDAAAEKSEA